MKHLFRILLIFGGAAGAGYILKSAGILMLRNFSLDVVVYDVTDILGALAFGLLAGIMVGMLMIGLLMDE